MPAFVFGQRKEGRGKPMLGVSWQRAGAGEALAANRGWPRTYCRSIGGRWVGGGK